MPIVFWVLAGLVLGVGLLALPRALHARRLDRDDPAKRAVARLEELGGLTGDRATIFFARREIEAKQ